MGAQQSSALAVSATTSLDKNAICEPATWRPAHVRALLKQFTDGQYDFGLNWATFEQLVTEALPTAATAPEYLWRRFDPGRSGLVNVLEVMVGLAVMCVGPMCERLDLVFDLCDFHGTGALSYDEVVVMIFVAVGSTVMLSGKGETPMEDTMETFTDDAYVTVGKDITDKLTKEDLRAWFAESFKLISLDDLEITITLRTFLRHFRAMAPPKKKQAHPNAAADYQSAAMADGTGPRVRLEAARGGETLTLS